MNALVIRLTRKELLDLVQDPETLLIQISQFEGKGHPDVISIILEDDTETVWERPKTLH